MNVLLESVFKFLMASAVVGAGVGVYKIYLFHFALCAFIFLLFIFYIFDRDGFPVIEYTNYEYLYVFYLMIAWSFLSLFNSVSFEHSLRYIYYVFIGAVIVYLINSYISNRSRYQELMFVYGFAFLLAVIVGLIEFSFGLRLPTSTFYSNYLPDSLLFEGLDDQGINFILKSPTSFWGNPNNFAIAMLIIFPFFLLNKRNVIKFLGCSLLFFLTIQTGSRAVMVAIMCAILLDLILFKIKKWYYFSFFIIIGVQFAILLMLVYSELVLYVLNEYFGFIRYFIDVLQGHQSELNSESIRANLIVNGLGALWNTAGVGVGAGASEVIQFNAGSDVLSMHNFWIEILVELGVLFFIIFAYWYASVVFNLYKIARLNKSSFYRYHSSCLFLSMITFIPGAISASSVIYFFPMWILFGMSIALIKIAKIPE